MEAATVAFATDIVRVPKARLWAGRVIGGWVVVFLVFDAAVKVVNARVAVEGTARLGYPVDLVVIIGIIELLSVLLYAIPRTSVIGALLLTAYLGGATATQVRVEDPWLVFPIVVGVMVWGALWLRDSRIAATLRQG